ncbi:sulfatase [Verrucomicrobium spinosum]|uniref:sulfatase n=1 Tax=Verrucomicrobium spinosum TaxID=2736 RepID=UPI0018DBEE93|nr:sulfatase [Verrucomicrobium spinosum]
MQGRFSRHYFLRGAMLAVGLTLGHALAFSAPKVTVKPAIVPKAQAARAGSPNVLFIIADDLNDWIGWMGGHPQARTPNMDRLARMGMRFMNAHCSYALCNPSRTSMLTGIQPWNSGVAGNEQDWRNAEPLQGKPTLPEYFRQQGYTTAAGGKVFHASHGGPEGRLTGWHGGRRGFEQDSAWDVRFPGNGVQIPDLPVHTGQNFNGLDIWHWDWGTVDVKPEATDDGQVVNWAAQYLQRKQPRPFFLTVGLYRPHAPWYVPRQYFAERPLSEVRLPEVKEDDLADVPAAAKAYLNGGLHRKMLDRQLWGSAVRAYLASISFCDAMVGRVLDALESSPNKTNTVIVFTSDHGLYLGEKQRWHKGGLWERVTHVPLVVVAPGVTQPDTQSSQAVSLVDLYPTLCELTGLPKPQSLDGISLVPLLRDPNASRTTPAVTAMGEGDKASYAVRTDRWRYIRYANGSEELYDHQSDPHEWTNLAGRTNLAAVQKDLAAQIPQKWVSAFRTVDQMKVDSSPDGMVSYFFQSGDRLGADASPDILERAFDIEVIFDYNPATNGDSTLLSQGDARLGFALHLVDGHPALTVNYDGLRSTLKSEEQLAPGQIRVRCLVSLDGSMSLAATGLTKEVRGYAPFEGGFPRLPTEGLSAGASFGPLPAGLFPNSAPFDGPFRLLRMTILPGVTEDRRAARAVPVE